MGVSRAVKIDIAQKLELPKSFATIKAACGQIFISVHLSGARLALA